jgi:hypothetical protein
VLGLKGSASTDTAGTQSGNQHSGGTNSGGLQMQVGVRAGVPDRGSFANDFGGDAVLGSPVPSRR